MLRLARLLRSDEVQVRRYMRGFFHGKAYLFRSEAVIAGSANFTYGGMVHNRELALARYDPGVVKQAEDWFDALWDEAEDYRADVLAEGQNLQQARYIVNYDVPWNPMRLVQRNGRIDRLGSPFAGQAIYLYNLFPAGELDQMLNLYERLLRKIEHANISVGMEAPVFEDAAAIERNFTDTAEQIRGIAGEDAGILEAAEARLDAFSGEEFRMELRRALAADRLRELRAMPHGAGSGFRDGERLPARAQTRIPASQAWALDLLADQGDALSARGAPASQVRDTAAVLSVPRGPLVQRRLAALRRELRDGDRSPAAAASGVLETVEDEGLRPADLGAGAPLTQVSAERVRLICFQVVHG